MNWIFLIVGGMFEAGFTACMGMMKSVTGWAFPLISSRTSSRPICNKASSHNSAELHHGESDMRLRETERTGRRADGKSGERIGYDLVPLTIIVLSFESMMRRVMCMVSTVSEGSMPLTLL